MGHLACFQITYLFFSMAWLILDGSITTCTFLGCSVLIIHAFVILFNGMIALLFSMQWRMSRLTLLSSNWHYKVLEFYYLKLSIIRSPFEKSCGIIVISFTSLFDKSLTQVCHTSTRCSHECHMNTLQTYNIKKF
jgi:hypothetical protein